MSRLVLIALLTISPFALGQQAGGSANGADAASDCCSPTAMTRIASSLGYIDLAGVRLGMTPKQAFAAVKAFNPALKIDIVNMRMVPGDDIHTFTRVPLFAVAHTVGLRPNPAYPALFYGADGSSDVIEIQFTIPPSPPLVGHVTRTVQFGRDKQVVASTLDEALRKKFGQDNVSTSNTRVWIFDDSGKPLTRRLTPEERRCVPGNARDGFGFDGFEGGAPKPDSLMQDSHGEINLANTDLRPFADYGRGLSCARFTFAMTESLGENVAPGTKIGGMTVSIDSPALLYASRKSAHDLLQGQLDRKNHSQDAAAQQQAAPKL
jgi:hypothetical protein